MSTSLTNFGTVTTKDVLARRFYLDDSNKEVLRKIDKELSSLTLKFRLEKS